jgi:hypothetical protein
MAARRRLRRRPQRRVPALRRAPAAGTQAARGAVKATLDGRASAGLAVGGAHDPAERQAERLAASALGPLRRSCAACAEEETARREPAAGVLAPGPGAAPAPAAARREVGRLSSGRALSAAERGFFEPRFGRDFGAVRLHEGVAADRAARALDARAFTLGQDIALGADGHDTATLAHELAHVAAGDAGLRRELRVKHDPGISLFGVLSKRFKVGEGTKCGMTEAQGRYFCPAFKTTGTVAEQIVHNMLASERVFRLRGDSQADVEMALDEHVGARQGAIDMARSIRLGFDARKARVGPTAQREIVDRYERRLKQREELRRKEGKSESEIRDEIDRLSAPTLHRVFEDVMETTEFDDIVRDILAKSAAYDAKKKKGQSPAFDYAVACEMATSLVMYGGSRAKMNQHTLSGGGLSAVDDTKAVWKDWVPGDWGYIRNTGTSTPAPGLEGENLVALGSGKFWAHFDPDNPITDLKSLFDMVKGWNTSAELSAKRRFPNAGLE